MNIEIERKFLVKNTDWKKLTEGVNCSQGYIAVNDSSSVRVRIMGEDAFITVKALTNGLARNEFNYNIPVEDAIHMLKNVAIKPVIEKKRYFIPYEGFTWEVDEFFGENEGLIVAEIELESVEQEFPKPSWVGEEVTDDKRYYNCHLITHPFCKW